MNQYSVVLRAINDNNEKFDLEVVNDPSFLIDISAIEYGDIGSVYGISTQQIALPGTDINNQFFNHLFDLGATPAVALNKSVPCQVLVDGEAVFTGKLYIQNIVTDRYYDVIYNCVITNETVDFRILNENKALSALDWSSYDHTYEWTNVSKSWNDDLFGESIFYPFVNYGSNPIDSQTPGFEFGGAKYQLDNFNTPLRVYQFKPAVQVKTIIDEIFNDINYKYTSSFIESADFQNLYMLGTSDDRDGLSFVTPTSGSYVYADVTQSFNSGFTTIAYTRLNFQQEVYDNGNAYNIPSQYYVASFTGEHIFSLNIPFNITSNFGPLQQANAGRKFVLQVYEVGSSVPIKGYTQYLKNTTSGVIATGNIPITLTAGQQIEFKAVLFTPSSNGREKFTTITTTGKNGVWLKAQMPTNPEGGTVDVATVFGDLTVLDFIQGLIDKFNLVIEPVAGERNLLKIEPYDNWIDQGETKDWTSIVDRNVKYQIEHPAQTMPAQIRFSDDIDDDILNQGQLKNDGRVYGEFTYVSDSDLPEGENTVGGFFAATPVKQLPVKGQNGTTVVPWLVVEQENQYVTGFKFKPRLLYKQPLQTIPDSEMFGIDGINPGTYYFVKDATVPATIAINYYRTALATNASPTDFETTLDLHYQNVGYWPFQQNVVNGQCQQGAYNQYWANYIGSLYDVDARLLTCNIVLNPSDIKDIKLNDKIFIDGHLYRINKIQGANLINKQSTVVQLLKLTPRKLEFTGKRRVSTGLNPEDYVDVVTGEYLPDGTVIYRDANTGALITNYDVLDPVSAFDGFEFRDGVVSWNNTKPVTFNPNVIVVGPNKFNESQNNVVVVGAGNDLSDNVNNVVVFGNDNTVSDAAVDTIVFASSASITESERVILIQPSGSRIISGSQNNVVINPINDIYSTDPTGSVYTGNLINQGTADFKSGQTVTGSVDITGSIILNGTSLTPIDTGSFESKTRFNHSFAADPSSELFVTIPITGPINTAYVMNYIMTSGSAAINAGQLQVTGDGTAASVDKVNERTLGGAPTSSFTAVYNTTNFDVKATFIGSDYTISGSVITMI